MPLYGNKATTVEPTIATVERWSDVRVGCAVDGNGAPVCDATLVELGLLPGPSDQHLPTGSSGRPHGGGVSAAAVPGAQSSSHLGSSPPLPDVAPVAGAAAAVPEGGSASRQMSSFLQRVLGPTPIAATAALAAPATTNAAFREPIAAFDAGHVLLHRCSHCGACRDLERGAGDSLVLCRCCWGDFDAHGRQSDDLSDGLRVGAQAPDAAAFRPYWGPHLQGAAFCRLRQLVLQPMRFDQWP